ncbi:MAG: hypothetical protein ABIL01_11335 [Pseudomonadota bacterium]|jgi:hypothetical protein
MKLPSLAMLAVSLSAAGCASSTPPNILPQFNAADPMMGVSAAHYHPVVTNYQHREPVDPKNWRQLNDDLSPAKRGSGS